MAAIHPPNGNVDVEVHELSVRRGLSWSRLTRAFSGDSRSREQVFQRESAILVFRFIQV